MLIDLWRKVLKSYEVAKYALEWLEFGVNLGKFM